MNIAQWIYAHALHTPDKLALRFDGEAIDYRDLAQRVAKTAELLGDHWGVKAGDRVAVLAANHPEVVVVLLACAELGAIMVPLNWRLAVPELTGIVQDCEPCVLLHDDTYAPVAATIAAQAPRAQRRVEELLRLCEWRTDLRGWRSALPALHADADILIVYTSGTTGTAKGAVLGQEALRCNARMAQHAYDMSSRDVILNFLPLFHVGGLNIQLVPALSLGATVVLQAKFDPRLALHAIEQHAVTLTNTVPTVLQAMVQHEAWESVDKSSLRAMSIGSTDVPVDLIDSVHQCGIPVIQIYGATETAPIALYQGPELARETLGSIGFAGFCCAVRLVDENGADVEEGAHGEIWVAGANVMNRYWRNPQATALALVDGWFRTGDVARRDSRGLHWFADRLKHVVISGGENIYPAELERVLRELPGLREAAVVGYADARWGEVPVAVVVREDDALQAATVLDCFHGVLARYKHPRHVVFVEQLPRNAMSKVVLAEVRAMVRAELG